MFRQLLRDTFPSVFEAWSLTNNGKALGIVWKFAHGRSLKSSLGQIFPDNSCGLSTVCPKVGHLQPFYLYLCLDLSPASHWGFPTISSRVYDKAGQGFITTETLRGLIGRSLDSGQGTLTWTSEQTILTAKLVSVQHIFRILSSSGAAGSPHWRGAGWDYWGAGWGNYYYY